MPIELPRYKSCFVCGDPARNPQSLGLCSYLDPESGVVTAVFTPKEHHVGYPDVVHGGILTGLLDEVSIWAASYRAEAFCVTRELRVKFAQAARPGEPLQLRAEVTGYRPRMITVQASVVRAGEGEGEGEGTVVARSRGKFYPAFPEEWEEWARRIGLSS